MENAMETSQRNISKGYIIEILDDLVKSFLAETSNIKFDKHNVQHLYLMCLYGRIFELGLSALNLIKANDHAGVPVILRSQLEAFVDFANLIEDKDFIKIIGATFVDQQKRLYKNLNQRLNASEIPPSISDATLKATEGYKPQNIWKRFENINLQKTYITAYFVLCGYGHNNLAMLEHRHLKKNGGDYKVVFFKDDPFTMWLRFALTLGATLVDSHKMLFVFFGKTIEPKAHNIFLKFKKLREDSSPLFNKGE